ncbi:hypothetical protein F8S13_22070 [Chloroflexia bacterium SDU3-3]|nr:hypothetical protein F8S13_22070 [Chloroflexia bacterium SDU3-3]
MSTLLAIDLGLRTGLALYGEDGRLRWYRSHNFGAASRLRKGAPTIVGEVPDLAWLVIEGGGQLATPWEREATRRGLGLRQIGAETWRQVLLYDREQRSGAQAKLAADDLARRVIAWSGASQPTALRHDAAEAILVGLWAVLDLGWLAQMPEPLRRGR